MTKRLLGKWFLSLDRSSWHFAFGFVIYRRVPGFTLWLGWWNLAFCKYVFS